MAAPAIHRWRTNAFESYSNKLRFQCLSEASGGSVASPRRSAAAAVRPGGRGRTCLANGNGWSFILKVFVSPGDQRNKSVSGIGIYLRIQMKRVGSDLIRAVREAP